MSVMFEDAPSSATEGHNTGVDSSALKDFARRIAALEDDRSLISKDIAGVKQEAKAAGFNTKALATCMSLMKRTSEDRAMIDLYAGALNVFD